MAAVCRPYGGGGGGFLPPRRQQQGFPRAAPTPPPQAQAEVGGKAEDDGRGAERHRAAQFSKTKMCKFEIVGMCSKGSECPYAHNKEELCPLPDLTCTKLCKTLIQTGACDNVNCTYAHSKEELRATSTFHKTKLCRFSQLGHCALGLKCNFAHSTAEIRSVHSPLAEGTVLYREATQPQPAPRSMRGGLVMGGGGGGLQSLHRTGGSNRGGGRRGALAGRGGGVPGPKRTSGTQDGNGACAGERYGAGPPEAADVGCEFDPAVAAHFNGARNCGGMGAMVGNIGAGITGLVDTSSREIFYLGHGGPLQKMEAEIFAGGVAAAYGSPTLPPLQGSGGGPGRVCKDSPAYVTQTASGLIAQNRFSELGPAGRAGTRLNHVGEAGQEPNDLPASGFTSFPGTTTSLSSVSSERVTAADSLAQHEEEEEEEEDEEEEDEEEEEAGESLQNDQPQATMMHGDLASKAPHHNGGSWGIPPLGGGKAFAFSEKTATDAGEDDVWQVKNTFLTFSPPPAKPIRSVRTAEGALCTLVALSDDEEM